MIIKINPTRKTFPSIKLYYQMPVSVRLGSTVFRVSVVYHNEYSLLRPVTPSHDNLQANGHSGDRKKLIIKNTATSSSAEI